MAQTLRIHRPHDIVPHEVATIVHDHMVDADFDDAQWAVERAMESDVTIIHTKPGLQDSLEANGLMMFVSLTTLD